MFKVYAQEFTTFAKLVMSTTEKKEKREGECGKRERERETKKELKREREIVCSLTHSCYVTVCSVDMRIFLIFKNI